MLSSTAGNIAPIQQQQQKLEMYNKKLMEREIARAIFGYNVYTVLLQLLCAVDNNTCFLVTQSVAFFSERKGKKTQVSAITINLPSSCDTRVGLTTE